MPRPGSLRFKSGMTSPEGATTNRISSSIGRTSRLTAHIRIVPDLLVRGPLSRSAGGGKGGVGGGAVVEIGGVSNGEHARVMSLAWSKKVERRHCERSEAIQSHKRRLDC